MIWCFELIAAKLAAVREGWSRRLIITAPRHLKSHPVSVAFASWCFGHDPRAQILCVSYTKNLRLRRRGLCPSPRDSLPTPR
jgi:hypothetical protein